jgi:hypothetical protein
METEDKRAERQEAIEAKKMIEQKTRQKEKERKNQKLVKLYEEITKNDVCLRECMIHLGLVHSNNNKLSIDGFESFILDCRKNGRLKNKETIKKDLRKAILEDYNKYCCGI